VSAEQELSGEEQWARVVELTNQIRDRAAYLQTPIPPSSAREAVLEIQRALQQLKGIYGL
jgi:hypothetical protein